MKLYSCCLVVGLCFALGLGGEAQRSSTTVPGRFNRIWFASASHREVSGFLDGYYDCTPDRAVRSLPGWSMPSDSLIEKIAEFYSQHPMTHLDVPEVATRVAASSHPPKHAPNGEVYKGRHGYYDGLWWQTPNLERLGYVEGYLECLGRPSSRSQSQGLVDAITSWYDKHPAKEDRPIASVLEECVKVHNKALHEP